MGKGRQSLGGEGEVSERFIDWGKVLVGQQEQKVQEQALYPGVSSSFSYLDSTRVLVASLVPSSSSSSCDCVLTYSWTISSSSRETSVLTSRRLL